MAVFHNVWERLCTLVYILRVSSTHVVERFGLLLFFGCSVECLDSLESLRIAVLTTIVPLTTSFHVSNFFKKNIVQQGAWQFHYFESPL